MTHRGPHTGDLITSLPIRDLTKPGGGAWKLKNNPSWKLSKVDTVEGEDVLSVFHEKNSGTSKDPGVGGITICAEPRGFPSTTGVVVAWDVFFQPGWDFVRGGKFGGMGVGPGVASGYRHSEDGASNRVMWQVDGGCIIYIYPPEGSKQVVPELRAQSNKDHGAGFFGKDFAKALKVGAWNRIELGTKLNTFAGSRPNADGMATMTVNGVSRTLKKVVWSKFPHLTIQSFDLGVFFGGPSPASKDCRALYKNFAVYKWKDGGKMSPTRDVVKVEKPKAEERPPQPASRVTGRVVKVTRVTSEGFDVVFVLHGGEFQFPPTRVMFEKGPEIGATAVLTIRGGKVVAPPVFGTNQAADTASSSSCC